MSAITERGGMVVAPPKKTEAQSGGVGLFFTTLLMAWTGITANKMRSFLTMLGVIIGVGAVIIAISIGQGSRAAVAESIQKLGTNVLTVFPGSQRRGGIAFGGGSSVTLKLADADAILKGCPSVSRVSPTVNRGQQIKYKNKNNNNSVTGTEPDYPIVSAHPVRRDGTLMPRRYVRSAACGGGRLQCGQRLV